MCVCACVCDAAATEMTVSADVEKMKTSQTPTQDATAACDTRDLKVDKERHPPGAFELEPSISKAQEATAEAITTAGSIAKPAPGVEIAKEPASALRSPAEVGVSTKVVEGDVVKSSEEKRSEDVLDDGTTVRKKVTTTKHVQPVTTVIRQTTGVEEQHTADKLLGTEVDEHVVILRPGVFQLREGQLEKETQVEESEDEGKDGTWVKRRVTTVTVKCKKSSATQRETDKPLETLPSSVPGSEQFAVDQRATQLPTSAVVSAEVPLKGSFDLNAPPQPSVSLHHEDGTKASLEEQSLRQSDVDSARCLEAGARGTKVELDRQSEDDQSKLSQSKPSIVPVKLTKLEPLSTDRTNSTVDTNKPAEVEQKSSTDERDTTTQQPQSGSPSVSVVRLTKLEPLSFERANGGMVSDLPRVEPTTETSDGSLLQRAPATSVLQAEQLQQPYAVHATTEEMIVPIPSTRQLRGRPACKPTTTPPLDDDLELRPAVDETPIQVERTVDQFANVKPAVEEQITETLASAPGYSALISVTLQPWTCSTVSI